MEDQIRNKLLELQDLDYKKFHSKLVPNLQENVIIGVRTPMLRAYAKELLKSAKADENVENGIKEFMKDLPHKYYEENNLHGFLIEGNKDFEKCIEQLDELLPYIDNWATCDCISPKVFGKNREELLVHIKRWLDSEDVYTIRYAVGMLMRYYLDELFREEYLEMVIEKQSDEYYINMMIAWYFATALAKQYDTVLPYIKNRRLSPWVHNKTIQKAVESNRISNEQKAELRTFKINT